MLLVVGALSVIRRAKQVGYTCRPWLTKLLQRRSTKIAAIALANKIARTAWAMMARRTYYQEPVSQGRGSCRTVDLAAESGPYILPNNWLISVGGAWRDGCGGGAEQMKGNDDRR
ncbi:MAG: hypothetical protein VCB77_06315 [Alphaproteobacteria bacterium]